MDVQEVDTFCFNLMERSLMSFHSYLVMRAAKRISSRYYISRGTLLEAPSTAKIYDADEDGKKVYFEYDDEFWWIDILHIEHQIIASPRGPLGFLIGHVSVYEESDG
jgi:hypothetical protein